MDSEDDMHDANDVFSRDDLYSSETAMESDDGEGDYDFIDSDTDHLDESSAHGQQQNYSILSEADILQRQEEDVIRVSTVLSIVKVSASILLCHYNWSVSKVHDEWFADEEKVRKAVGLLEKPVFQIPNARKLTCGICFESYPRKRMNAAACGHPFCSACWTGYISTSVNSGPGCLMLRCPDPSCRAAVSQDMINILASDEDKKKFSRYLLRSYIEDNRKINDIIIHPIYILYTTEDSASTAGTALVLDVAFLEVAEDSIDAPVLSSAVFDVLYFFLSIPVQLSCSSYGSYIEKECES
ncbi:hypothetical protein HHK36_022175 [Tetracentron sinense]|uniref:RBR-type E3 ubiquitin transferase n=1 Tax=Tetracentron sinense TaxID=13715 RepID=A0A834YTT8_TETSI|nr:hypothetical protein HHK36_022175 [Tetracentron sinense]